MKTKVKIMGIIGVILMLGLFSGCTSPDGIRLGKAAVKQLNVKSMQADSQISLSIKTSGLDIAPENQQIIDQINQSTVNISEQSDVKNNKYAAKINLSIGQDKYDASLYSRANKIWMQIPGEEKYIEYDPSQLRSAQGSVFSYKEQLKLQNKIKPKAIQFVKDYIADYKYSFKNISSKGNVTVTTPEGSKEITQIEVKIDNNEVKDLIKYTVDNMVESDALVEYIKSIMVIMYEEDPEVFEGQSIDEVLAELEGGINGIRAQIDTDPDQYESLVNQAVDQIMQYIGIGEQGVVLTYGLDKDNNIVTTDTVMDLTFRPEGNDSQVINAVLKSKSTIYNINKTKVNIPNIAGNNSIKLKEYLRSNPVLKESELGKMFGVEHKRINMQIGSQFASTNDRYNFLEAEPYIEGEYTMVPVRFVGESLGADIQWNDETQEVTYTDDDNTIVLTIGSTTAYVNGEAVEMPVAPLIKSERTMVPLRFVSERLGAKVEWNDEESSINIDKE